MSVEPLLSLTPQLFIDVVAPAQSWLSKATPFLAALLGAGIGGATGMTLQKNQFRNQQRQLDDDRADAEEALGLSILFKLNRVHTTIFRVRELLDSGMARASLDGHPERRWAYTLEYVSDLPRIDVTIDDLVFVKRLHDLKAMDGFMDLQELNNVYVDTSRMFGELKKALSAKMIAMGPPVEVIGDRVASNFTEAQMRTLEPEMARLNKLLGDLEERARRDGPTVHALFHRIQGLVKMKLGSRAMEFDLAQPTPYDESTKTSGPNQGSGAEG